MPGQVTTVSNVDLTKGGDFIDASASLEPPKEENVEGDYYSLSLVDDQDRVIRSESVSLWWGDLGDDESEIGTTVDSISLPDGNMFTWGTLDGASSASMVLTDGATELEKDGEAEYFIGDPVDATGEINEELDEQNNDTPCFTFDGNEVGQEIEPTSASTRQSEYEEGNDVTVEFTVENKCGRAGTASIDVDVNGSTVNSFDMTDGLDAGDTRDYKDTHSASGSGTQDVEVTVVDGGSKSTSYEIPSDDGGGGEPDPVDGLLERTSYSNLVPEGTTVEISSVIENTTGSSHTYITRLAGKGESSPTVTVASNFKKSVDLNTTVTSEIDTDLVLEGEDSNGSWKEVDRKPVIISIKEQLPDIGGRIDDISFRREVPEGTDVPIDVTVSNTTSEAWEYSVSIDGQNEDSGFQSVSANSSRTFQITYTATSDLDSQITLIGIDENGSEKRLDTKSISITALEPITGVIDRINFPGRICIGNRADIDLTIRNTTSRSGRFRVKFQETGDTLGPVEDNGGVTSEFTFQTTVDSNIDSQVTLEGEDLDGNWKRLDTKTVSIGMDTPSFSVSSVEYPSPVSPGEKHEAVIRIVNDSDCEGSFELTSDDFNDIVESMDAGEVKEVVHTFTVLSPERTFEATLSSDWQNDIQISETVKAHSAVFIETNADTTFVGSQESPITFEAVAEGTDLEVSRVEDADTTKVGPLRKGAIIESLKADTYEDIDVLTYSNLDLFKGQATTSVAWVLDGEVQGTAPSFEYNTTFSGGSVPDDQLVDNPEISVTAGPAEHIGRFTNRLFHRFKP